MTAHGIFVPRKPVNEGALLAQRGVAGGGIDLEKPETHHDIAISLGEKPSERRKAHLLEGTKKDWKESLSTLPATFKAVERKALQKASEMSNISDIKKLPNFPKSVANLLDDYWGDAAKVNAIYEAALNVPSRRSQTVVVEKREDKPLVERAAPKPYNGLWNPPPSQAQKWEAYLRNMRASATKLPTDKELAKEAASSLAAIKKKYK